MDKQGLLNQVQAAKSHLDRAAGGQHEIGNILSAVAQLADVLEQIIPAIDKINARIDRLSDYVEGVADNLIEAIDG